MYDVEDGLLDWKLDADLLPGAVPQKLHSPATQRSCRRCLYCSPCSSRRWPSEAACTCFVDDLEAARHAIQLDDTLVVVEFQKFSEPCRHSLPIASMMSDDLVFESDDGVAKDEAAVPSCLRSGRKGVEGGHSRPGSLLPSFDALPGLCRLLDSVRRLRVASSDGPDGMLPDIADWPTRLSPKGFAGIVFSDTLGLYPSQQRHIGFIDTDCDVLRGRYIALRDLYSPIDAGFECVC